MTKNEKHKILFYLNFAEVFFIDDINWVAEVSKPLDAGFMGVPSSMPYNYLREEMIATGVIYRVNRFKDITENLYIRLTIIKQGLGLLAIRLARLFASTAL